MTNIKFRKQSNISDCSKDENLNQEISNWVQHGKQALEKERTPLEQIDANTFSPKKFSMPETSSTTSNFDDASCASSFSSLSAQSSPITINSSLLSPTRSTCTFKKPSYV